MGNTVQYLKDPALVRSIQEKFGVHQIAVEVKESSSEEQVGHRRTCSSGSSSGDDSAEESQSEGLSSGSETKEEVEGEMHCSSSSSSLQGSLKWLSSKARVRRRIRTPPPHSSACHSYAYTNSASPPKMDSKDVPEVLVVETNSFFDTYFRLATEVGYEPFYITFLPMLLWNVDTVLARHAIIVWAMSMYIGQGFKQLFKIKRPASPPAIRLEDNPLLETEYGFPSTHATVGTSMPFSLLYSCVGRYEFPLWLGLLVAFSWSISVMFSRLYLGVHSVLDVIGGCLIAVCLFPVIVLFINLIEHWYFVYNYPYTPVFLILLVIFLVYIYPVNSQSWSRDRGDTAAIVGSSMGILLGQCAIGHYPDDLNKGPFQITVPSVHMLSLCVVRFVVGLLLLLPARFIMKLLCYKLLPRVMPTHGVKEVVKRPLVELPYKIITYGALGFIATYLNVIVFEICGISRWEQSVFS